MNRKADTLLGEIVQKGKKNKGDPKKQGYINLGVIAGFVFLFIWTLFFYPKTFVPLRIVLILLLAPSLMLTLFISTRVLEICGYAAYLKRNVTYTIIIHTLSYILITVPVGNFLVLSFLFVNRQFAGKRIETLSVQPFNVGESYSNKSNDHYSHFDITVDGIKKQVNMGSTPVEDIIGRYVEVEVSKGYFGYYVMWKRKLL